MFDELDRVLGAAEAAMRQIDPDRLVGTQPAACIDRLIRHQRATSALLASLTARAEQMHPWQREGYHSFDEWLAAKQGTSQGAARRRAATARKLKERRRTSEALANGDISEDEADVIADAADKNPAAEQDLIDTARNKNRSHNDLKDRAAEAKASAEDDKARAERHRRGRTARWGVDRDGFWTLHGRFQPEVGGQIKKVLQAHVNRIFAANRSAGTREPLECYHADAVAAAVTGRDPATVPGPDHDHDHDHDRDRDRDRDRDHDTASGPGPVAAPHADPCPTSAPGPGSAPASASGAVSGVAPAAGPDPEPGAGSDPAAGSDPGAGLDRAAGSDAVSSEGPVMGVVPKELVLVIDLDAMRRRSVNPGETCHIRGVGPVPVDIARQWVDDAFIKAVIRDGNDVRLVHHFGTTVNARLRTALDLVEPTCAVPRCHNDSRLEYHHLDPRAEHGPTSLNNLSRLCVACHRLATHGGYQLAGTPGHRHWINTDGIVEQADDPTLVGHPPPVADPTTRRVEPDQGGIDITTIDTVEEFDQLVLLEPARAP